MLAPPSPTPRIRIYCCCCCCGCGVIAVLVLVVFKLLFLYRRLRLLLSCMLAPPLPHTENSVFRRFCHKPPSPRRWTLFVGKRQYKKTVKLIIFHPRAGRPGGIRASDLEAPYQNCLVVQRAAKRPFGPPYLPPNSGIFAPLCQHPPSPTPPLILTSFAG